jgi:gluconokinase
MSLNNKTENKQPPLLVVVMGVSGCGKSTLAQEIANTLAITFLDADSFHSEDAIKQMSQGIPLTDEQRAPWIALICQNLSELEAQNKCCVLAYSGLKQEHRRLIFGSYCRTVGVFLDIDPVLIAQRLSKRGGHFMSPKLLSSQLASMEAINKDVTENIELLTLSAEESVAKSLIKSLNLLNY